MNIANRTQELQLFNRIVQGSFAKRILLIEAKSGFGKTELLRKFKHNLPENTSLLIDLKGAELGILYIFSRVRSFFGQERFPALNAAMQRFSRGGVEVSETMMIGMGNQLSVVLQNDDETIRKLRLTELREAFFQDLRNICQKQKLVFLFDSYEKAPHELREWLGGGFLAEVVDTPQLIVVIAGQHIPEPTSECIDLCHRRCLEAISEPEAWYDYTKEAGFTLTQDAVKAAMIACYGQPALITTTLERLAKEW